MKILTIQIREDYGTLERFCKVHEINKNTFKNVIYGYATSLKIINLLKKHNYIKNADELKRVKK